MRQFDAVWATLERWSPRLYLFAGVLLVGYAALNGIAAFTDVAYVTVEDVVGPAGLLLGFVGLLGLYPTLVDGRPVLARAGAVCVSLGALGFLGITITGFAVLAGVTSASVPVVMLLVVAIGMIPGYLSFSLASLRVEAQTRTVGLLLLAPAVVFSAMLSQPFVYSALGMFSGSTMAWSNFAISGGQAVAHLAIGYVLRHEGSPAGREVPSTGVIAG
jgi:hypothetical protein